MYSGAFYNAAYGSIYWQYSGTMSDHPQDGGKLYDAAIALNASITNSAYGKSDTVQPPAVILIPQLRY